MECNGRLGRGGRARARACAGIDMVLDCTVTESRRTATGGTNSTTGALRTIVTDPAVEEATHITTIEH